MDTYNQVVDYIVENQEKFYRLAYSYVHNKEEAFDIVQNAIVKALENYKSIREIAFLKTWFYRVLVNESINYTKASSRVFYYAPEKLKEESYFDPGLEPGYELYQYVDRLPEKMKTVITLHFYEDMTLKEVAVVTGVNLNTVKYRLYAGLKRIRAELLKEGEEDEWKS